MAVLTYQKLMKPLVELVADGQVHSIRELADRLAGRFGLTPEERNALLPSGIQRRFDCRVGWARTHLLKAGLLTSPGRGTVQITHRG